MFTVGILFYFEPKFYYVTLAVLKLSAMTRLALDSYLIRFYLYLLSIVVMHHHAQSNLGKIGFVWLTLPHFYSSSKEVMTGTQTGKQPGGRS